MRWGHMFSCWVCPCVLTVLIISPVTPALISEPDRTWWSGVLVNCSLGFGYCVSHSALSKDVSLVHDLVNIECPCCTVASSLCCTVGVCTVGVFSLLHGGVSSVLHGAVGSSARRLWLCCTVALALLHGGVGSAARWRWLCCTVALALLHGGADSLPSYCKFLICSTVGRVYRVIKYLDILWLRIK